MQLRRAADQEVATAGQAGRGVGIFVGDEERTTRATLQLRDVDEVGRFLDELARRLRTGS